MVPKPGFGGCFGHKHAQSQWIYELWMSRGCPEGVLRGSHVPFLWGHVVVTLWSPCGHPGQIRQKYHPRNLYNKSARKNEASLHGSLRPTLKNCVSPTRNHRFHECTKRAKIMKLIPKAGLLWLIMSPEMWTWWCENDVTSMLRRCYGDVTSMLNSCAVRGSFGGHWDIIWGSFGGHLASFGCHLGVSVSSQKRIF